MQKEKYAIYCFSLQETRFAPVGFDPKSNQSMKEIFFLSAWINKIMHQTGKERPTSFENYPDSFRPKLLGYCDFSEIGPENYISNIVENIIVVLMPSFPESDLELLQMILGQRYNSHIRRENIAIHEPQDEILELKPNWIGIGLDLKALWKKLFK